MTTRTPLVEDDLKAIVLNKLRSEGEVNSNCLVASEFRLGNTSVRVDLAILATQFIGVEVKSERDSLKRLPSQVAAYSRYFDRVIIAVSEKHVRNVDWRSLSAAEVWTVDRSGRVSVAAYPETFTNTRCLSELLTGAQLVRHRRTENFAEDDHVRRAAFEEEFGKRFGYTSKLMWSSIGDRAIRADDIATLSRFREQREAYEAWAHDRKLQMQAWLSELVELDRASEIV